MQSLVNFEACKKEARIKVLAFCLHDFSELHSVLPLYFPLKESSLRAGRWCPTEEGASCRSCCMSESETDGSWHAALIMSAQDK